MKIGIKRESRATSLSAPARVGGEPASNGAGSHSQEKRVGLKDLMYGESAAKPGVYLIRHANTALNTPASGKEMIRGHLNPPLDAGGQKQSADIAEHAIKAIKPEQVISSDLQRATHTADHIASGVGSKALHTHIFRPWDLGNLQGKSAEAAAPIIAEHAKPENHQKPVPGGEPFESFSKRFLSGLQKVMDHFKSTGQTVAVVTHYRGLKLAQSWLDAGGKDKIDQKTFSSNDTPTGAVMRIYPEGKIWKYEMMKDVPGAGGPEKGQRGT